MSKDLKGYLKNSKSNKNNNITSEENNKAREIAKELSGKSQSQLSSDFQSALATSKANGTFNKEEMLKMLSGIKGNMSSGEFERIKNIIASL